MKTPLNYTSLTSIYRYQADGSGVVKKGRNTFTQDQAEGIRQHLLNLAVANPGKQQKELIQILKEKYQFYITDFTDSRKRFTPDDFDDLVNKGEILISA